MSPATPSSRPQKLGREEATMGRIRDKMEQDLVLGGKRAATQEVYLRYARQFAIYTGRSPEQATNGDVRRWLLHLLSTAGRPDRFWFGESDRGCCADRVGAEFVTSMRSSTSRSSAASTSTRPLS